MYYGAHINNSNSLYENLDILKSYGGNFLQIYTDDIDKLKSYNIDKNIKIVIHGALNVNLSRFVTENKNINLIIKDFEFGNRIGSIGVVIHCGKSLNLSLNTAYKNMIESITHIINKTNNGYLIIETCCGAGTEIAVKIEELARIWNGLSNNVKKRVRFCIDTAHIYVAGYDISK